MPRIAVDAVRTSPGSMYFVDTFTPISLKSCILALIAKGIEAHEPLQDSTISHSTSEVTTTWNPRVN